MAAKILPVNNTVQVKAASTGNLTLSGAQTVDGVALVANDLCLAKDQSAGGERGIYVVESGAWTLCDPGPSDGLLIEVLGGTVNGDLTYKVTNAVTWGSGTPTFANQTPGASGGTLIAPVISGGLTASGSAPNTFAGSTGTFLTSTGAVTIGPGAVTVSGDIVGDLTFTKEANHAVYVKASTTASTIGGNLAPAAGAGTPAASGAAGGSGGIASLTGGAGGAAFAAASSAAGLGGVAKIVGGAGGAAAAHAGGTSAAGGGAQVTGGVGGAASADAAASAGGAVQIAGGVGGVATAAQAAGAGGAVSIVGGAAGSNTLGGGAANGGAVNLDAGAGSAGGTGGAMSIGTTNASTITIGKTSNSIGIYGATPVAQPSSTGQTAGFTAGSGSAVLDDSTFTGGDGSKAYTIGDIVKHLKALGLLAAS